MSDTGEKTERASAKELAWQVAEADYNYISPIIVDKQMLAEKIARAIREAEQAVYRECQEVALGVWEQYRRLDTGGAVTRAETANIIAGLIEKRMTDRRVDDLLYGRG